MAGEARRDGDRHWNAIGPSDNGDVPRAKHKKRLTERSDLYECTAGAPFGQGRNLHPVRKIHPIATRHATRKPQIARIDQPKATSAVPKKDQRKPDTR